MSVILKITEHFANTIVHHHEYNKIYDIKQIKGGQ